MDAPELKDVRVLIVDSRPYSAQLLRGILDVLGVQRIAWANSTDAALGLMRAECFDAVFLDEAARPANPVSFALAVRRDTRVLDPMVPVILVSGAPRRRHVELTRDAGANDLIARPVSPETVRKKLIAVTKPVRSFIATDSFVGPDRRHTPRPYAGEERRHRKPRKFKLGISDRQADQSEPA